MQFLSSYSGKNILTVKKSAFWRHKNIVFSNKSSLLCFLITSPTQDRSGLYATEKDCETHCCRYVDICAITHHGGPQDNTKGHKKNRNSKKWIIVFLAPHAVWQLANISIFFWEMTVLFSFCVSQILTSARSPALAPSAASTARGTSSAHV